MILSKSSRYAVNALVAIAKSDDGDTPVGITQIVELGIAPTAYLRKILQRLVQAGFLRSFKGPSGGFKLERPASAISLYDVVAKLDYLDVENVCLLSENGCRREGTCAAHKSWQEAKEKVIAFLKLTTIADLAIELKMPKSESRRIN